MFGFGKKKFTPDAAIDDFLCAMFEVASDTYRPWQGRLIFVLTTFCGMSEEEAVVFLSQRIKEGVNLANLYAAFLIAEEAQGIMVGYEPGEAGHLMMALRKALIHASNEPGRIDYATTVFSYMKANDRRKTMYDRFAKDALLTDMGFAVDPRTKKLIADMLSGMAFDEFLLSEVHTRVFGYWKGFAARTVIKV